MKSVIQRGKDASVNVQGEVKRQIENGFVIRLGVTHDDTIEDVEYLVNKIVHLRVFEDENQKMNLSLKDVGGSILSISQFTLYGDTRKGRRPIFTKAARPQQPSELYQSFNEYI